MFNKKVSFEIKWTLRNFDKITKNLLWWNFCGKVKMNEVSWQLKEHTCEQWLSEIFFFTVLPAVDSAPIRTLRVKSNIKFALILILFFLFETVTNTIKNSDGQGKVIGKDNFTHAKRFLKLLINRKTLIWIKNCRK